MKINLILLSMLAFPVISYAQTAEEMAKIASFSNKEANQMQRIALQKAEKERLVRIADYLKANPGKSKVLKNNAEGKVEIMDVLPTGEIVIASNDNAGAATTARATALYGGGSLGINIQGQNMTAGVWDGGNVLDTHQEFMVGGVSKVTNYEVPAYGDHATHVAGTIAAQGIDPTARGIAFNSSILSFDWNDDLNEMLTRAGSGLLTSNHSYGMGVLGSVWFFGAYDTRARSIDLMCSNNPYYLPVFSAGNSRNLTTPPASTQLAAKLGYDLIFGHGNAKNILTVAAVEQVTTYTGAGSVNMSTFSSFGPSDDKRIKPDISMKGVGVKSTVTGADNASYASENGTSMASPGITGVVLLLQQYYNQLYSSFMRAATVKGVMLHTADEAGTNPGPDLEFGWGLVNAEKAAKTIRDKNLTVNGSVIEERVLTNGATFTRNITAGGISPLKVSISWTDPAPPTTLVNSGTNDPVGVKYLVNDLDLKVTSSTGTVYYPWRNDFVAPFYESENNAPNNVDNFERVDIDLPVGTYTITVTHKGTLAAAQNFTLVATADTMVSLGTNDVKQNADFDIFPNPTSDFINIQNVQKGGAKISIVDASGRIVFSKESKETKINVKEFVPGVYTLIYVDKQGNQISKRFIKK